MAKSSLSPTSTFLSAGDRCREKKAQGCNFPSSGGFCERTAPTPVSEASTFPTNCIRESGCDRMGAEENSCFNSQKAASASGIQILEE